jgi:Na+/proline symporter
MVFVPLVSVVGIYKIGVMNFVISIPVAKYHASHLWQDTLMLFLSFSFMGMYPGFIQRSFMTEDAESTKKAIYGKSLLYLVFLICISLNGLISYFHYQGSDGNLALLHLIDDFMPIGLKGMVIVGFLAAVMSTADSELNIASISLTNDVLSPVLKLHDTKIILLFTQIATLLIGSVAIYLALKFDNTVELFLIIAGFWLPIALVPFIFALYNITIGNVGMIVSAVFGLSSFIYWQSNFADIWKLKSAFVGLSVNLMSFLIIKSMQIARRKLVGQSCKQ